MRNRLAALFAAAALLGSGLAAAVPAITATANSVPVAAAGPPPPAPDMYYK